MRALEPWPGEIYYKLIREAYYTKLNSNIEAVNMAASVHKEIQEILSFPWFTAITSVQSIRLQKTPLFLYNSHYRAIYNALHEIVEQHPLLLSTFDENLYGVHETTLIYEYWVFYELLDRLLNLDFKIEGNTDRVKDHLQDLFVEHLLKSMKPEGFAVCLHRDIKMLNDSGEPSGEVATVEVLIGFNCIFGDQEAPAHKKYDKYLTPDYFIRITREDGYHWYFLDAKYENYSETMLYTRAEKGQRKNSINDVCVDKYINRMQKSKLIDEFAIFHSEEYPDYWKQEFLHSNFIEGAYLIIARYQNEPDEQISLQDRLCGNSSHGITNEKPLHKFGSIVLRPKKTDEITTLLEMIFEYKEGSECIRVGKPQLPDNGRSGENDIFNDKHAQITLIHVDQAISKFPLTLYSCWNSSNDHTMIDLSQQQITISPQLTKSDRYKYLVTCSCGARRYENYCICKECRREIIKHDSGNYHFRNSKEKNYWDKWNYVCPYCGCDINLAND